MITALPTKHVPTLPPDPVLERHLAQLDEDGFTVIPRFLEPATTAAIRAHIDALAGPVRRADEPAQRRAHDLRHPIPGDLMADLVTAQHVELAQRLLGVEARGMSDGLRLTEQVLIRSDPMPGDRGPVGWHIDFAFCPRHLAARPRQIYVQMVHALSTVQSGGAAFMIVPGSHHATLAAAARLAGPGACSSVAEQTQLKAEVMRTAGIDLSAGIEVLPADGDLILFHPMCAHSASRNVRTDPRYVLFMSFFDVAAAELHEHLRRESYRDRFPESLRSGLPEHMRSLLTR